MDPVRRDFGQRAHDKKTSMRPWVRKNNALFVDDTATQGNKIEIQRARRMGHAAPASEVRFQIQQCVQSVARR
jgi:hypothetical protein